MLSERANKIIEDVDNVRKDTEIEPILEKYPEKLDRGFIQKYAEIKISVFSTQITYASYFIALVIVIVTFIQNISETLFPGIYQKYDLLNYITLIALFILLPITFYLFIKEFSKINVLKNIIVEIDDADRYATQERYESIIISKLNEISQKLTVINQKTDFFEKTISDKLEIIEKKIIDLERTKEPRRESKVQ